MLTARIVASAAAALALAPFSAFAQDQPQAQTNASAEPETEAASEPSSTVMAAEPADFRIGLEVHDTSGGLVGTVEAVDGEGAIVNTGQRRAKLPFASFGKNERGLVISLSGTELEAAAAAEAGG